jgi:hypothetical protein
MRVGDDRVKKSAAVQLRWKFDLASFNDGETVEDYALRLQGMVATLATLGEVVDESKIMEKIIRSVPARFKQIVLAITTLLDVSTMSLTDLVGRLKAAEDSFEEAPTSLQHDGRLYLTKEEWDARRKKREAENRFSAGSSVGSGSGSTRRGHGRGRGRGRGGPPAPNGKPTGDECRKCGKMGHWARECHSKPKKEQAHVAREEEEASLLLMRASSSFSPAPTETQPPPPSPSAGVAGASASAAGARIKPQPLPSSPSSAAGAGVTSSGAVGVRIQPPPSSMVSASASVASTWI